MKFEDFKVCKDFVNKDKSKILNYVQALYHRNSELNNIQNLQDRKLAACAAAKLNPRDPQVIDIMDLKNEEVNWIIDTYLGLYQNSNAYHQLQMDQEMLWRIQRLLLSPIETLEEDELIKKYQKRAELAETGDTISRRINRSISEIYTTPDVQEVATTHIRQMKRIEERIKERA